MIGGGLGGMASAARLAKQNADKTAADDLKNQGANEAALTKANDQDGLFNMAFNLVFAGQAEKGISLMEAAMKAGVKYPEDAKIRLGQAYSQAGNKSKAISTLKGVKGTDGTAELARYWIMWVNRPAGGNAQAQAAQ